MNATTAGARRWRVRFGIVLAAVTLAVLPACDSSDDVSTTPEAPWTAPYGTNTGTATTPGSVADAMTIMITDFKFDVPTTVRPGAEISVVNGDAVEHTMTSDVGGVFDEVVDGNDTTTFNAPMAPGSYPFHCTRHPDMQAILVVE
ncbi:cupredoxin domain-containing protein [Rhodococcus daqingensis]|uniref:Cupredoxin domain-containing protein n=1 Tax=Rhodococcus daqingensis TaxID=2479363 RepID=A0ABW2S1B2_9NOCA